MTKSTEIKNLATALAKFQSEVGAVKKESTNPFFKSRYADLPSILAEIKEPLSKNGLSFSQFPTGENQLTTILMHISGEWIEDTFTMKPVDQKPQSLGSVITYMRRYALGAILGIATEEDDDGNEASGTGKKQVKQIVEQKTNLLEQAKKYIESCKNQEDLMTVAERIESNKDFTQAQRLQLRKLIDVKNQKFEEVVS